MTPHDNGENILEEALRITNQEGERRQDYGSPLDDAARVAHIVSAITGATMNPEQVPLMMIAVKLSRQINRPKRDNLVDIAGWARVAEEIDAAQRDLARDGQGHQ
jgi:hypothetical protein